MDSMDKMAVYIVAIVAIVLIALMTCITTYYVDENDAAFRNGYQQFPYAGANGCYWVKK